ncbi:hypothetical protein HYD58_00245 [Mycoplasmopsis bovis]|nr:hypothetical protein [Mycoplasmopsis bovis]QQH65981.1 hypothetical protein HYD58_00245 [Mycoplasmopsis bovis]
MFGVAVGPFSNISMFCSSFPFAWIAYFGSCTYCCKDGVMNIDFWSVEIYLLMAGPFKGCLMVCNVVVCSTRFVFHKKFGFEILFCNGLQNVVLLNFLEMIKYLVSCIQGI